MLPAGTNDWKATLSARTQGWFAFFGKRQPVSDLWGPLRSRRRDAMKAMLANG